MSANEHDKRATKWKAIFAHRRGKLSKTAATRVEAHIASSSEAQRVVATDALYESMAESVRSEATREPRWDQIELGIARAAKEAAADAATPQHEGDASEARRTATRPRFGYWAVGVAAAVALAWFGSRALPGAPAEPNVARGPERPPAPVFASILATVDAVTGSVRARTDESPAVDVRPGSRLASGTTLETAHHASVHVGLYGTTGIVLDGDATLRLAPRETAPPMARHRIVLALDAGMVTSRVDPLDGEGARFDVLAGAHMFRVVGTHFAVAHRGNDVALRVDDGRVEVWKDGVRLALVEAPGTWGKVALFGADADLAHPYLPPTANDDGPTVTVPAVAGMTGVDINGMRIGVGGAELRVRVAPGPVEVIGWAGPRKLFESRVEALEGEVRIEAPSESRDDGGGVLTPDEIQRVVAPGAVGLRRCRDLASRQAGDEVVGQFRLAVHVGTAGIVERAALTGAEDAPSAFRSCVLREVRAWRFPRPRGGSVDFELPLTFVTPSKGTAKTADNP
ncbi:MAG: AgmX/PglI C-terminal domain-containing protein [Polyangiales bacterium]